MPRASPSTSASMGIYIVAFTCRCFILLLLNLGGPSLGNSMVRADQHREHFIVAQVTNWNYRSQSADPSRSQNSGPFFQKIIYREYEANFRDEKPVNALTGLLGPTLRAEVGDKLIVHFKNLANKPLSLHPQGIVYNKQSEGSSYSDRTSPLEKLDDAVPSGQMYTYVWEITEESGPRKADPPCLTYAYYSHVNMVQDFNSGLVGALLICKKGSLNENGTQKLFDREYVLVFAVFDESKSWKKETSLMYTINGYANGTLPDVQTCAYERISWHLIGMSSTPEIFSVHFNGQTLEQNRQRKSTVSLVGGASATANMTVSQMGKWLISSLVQKHLQAGMYGYLNIEDCGNVDILTRKLTLKELRMINNWDYFIAAEEIVWDYAPEIPEDIDREYKVQHLDNFSNIIGKKYKKAVFRQYKDATFSKRAEVTRPNELGILGPVIRAEVKDTVTITFKNMASRPYSIYVHGVTLSKAAEGAVYPSDSKDNSTHAKAVQPGETYTYKWTVLDTDEPTSEDAQCLTRSYHSAVDVTRDIASGLIGPLLICKRKALNKKGIQNKADVEQHAVFAVFDENKSWYLEDNIKEYCSNPSAVKREDPKFYKSNIMHTLNGFVSERAQILGFCQEEIVEWHLTSIGAQDEIIPVHISGHTFLNRGKHQDIVNLFPMSGESATVTMDNIGTWLLGTWDSREMSNGMRLKFRDVQCDHDYQQYGDEEDYDAVFYHTVSFATEKPKVVPSKPEQQKQERDASPDSEIVDYDYQDSLAADLGLQNTAGNKVVIRNEDDDYQDTMATILGLRTFQGSVAQEEEQNLTALAIQDIYNISSLSGVDITVTSELEITNGSEELPNVKLLETTTITYLPTTVESLLPNYTFPSGELTFSEVTTVTPLRSEQGQGDQGDNATYSSGNYSQMPETLSSDEGRQSNDTAELLGVRVKRTTSIMPNEEEEQAEDAVGEDGMDGNLNGDHERRAPLEAKLHALRKMFALLFHVQQKRNLSCLSNSTSNLPFLAIPHEENISSLETDTFSYYYDETEEEASTEFPLLLANLTLTVGFIAETNSSEPLHVSEPELSEVQQHDNSTLKSVLISTLVPKMEKKTRKASLHKKQKCLSEKTDHEWNVVSKESDIKGAELPWAVDSELQNYSKNGTIVFPENTMSPNKRKHKTYKGDSQLVLDKSELNNNEEVLNEKRHENCNISSSGTFLKIKRRKKTGVLAPRTHRPLETPKEVQYTANRTTLLNETKLTQNQGKPFVRIGLPSEDGDFREYDIENFDSEQSSSGSFEYQTVHYDNPYTTDSRLDVTTVRNPDDIAGRYLRTFSKGNLRRYYIAAEEILWDYAAFRKSTMKSDSASTRYTKVIFRSYQDETFRTPEVGGEYEEHLGILGPVIRAEVDDVIQVQFKNKASRPYSLHAHGLSYEKSSEGRSYNDESPEWFKTDDAIKPNGSYTYVWHATKRSGPSMQDRRICRLWAYYSAVNPEKDIHSGLIGPILVCQKGMLDMFNRPTEMRAFILLFMVFNEEKSWYFDKHAKKTRTQKISGPHHTYPAINGISYDLPGLLMYKNEDVHWHMLNMGGPKDIHVINFHGQTFVEQEIEEHQLGVYPLFPGSFHTIEMKPPKAGVWLVDTEIGEYQEAGMQASFTVIDAECKLPMGLESGIIQDSQISASGHVSYWEPKLARLNNAGKYNAWSTEKKENEFPWIQVDLERQAVITGIQTQGAMQLMKNLYTKEYFITYSQDGRKWNVFKGNHTGTQKLFKGNSDAREVKENNFDPPIIARYIRVYPTKFFYRPILRMELLGCEIEGCFMPLGMESGAIKNAQITASSYKKNWVSSWEPSLARLNLKGRVNAWQAKSNNNNQWLQIDLLQTKKISAIATQGAKSLSSEMYVKSFAIAYSDDGSAWKSYLDTSTSMDKVFIGNVNSSRQAKQFFNPPIFSRFIRVIPKTWNQKIVLRLELFGCDVF